MVFTSSGLLASECCPCVSQLSCEPPESRNHILDFLICLPIVHLSNTSHTHQKPRLPPGTGDITTVLHYGGTLSCPGPAGQACLSGGILGTNPCMVRLCPQIQRHSPQTATIPVSFPNSELEV